MPATDSGTRPPALAWRKASRSAANGECVEVAVAHDGRIAIRDSKNPEGAVVTCSPETYQVFLHAIKAAPEH